MVLLSVIKVIREVGPNPGRVTAPGFPAPECRRQPFPVLSFLYFLIGHFLSTISWFQEISVCEMWAIRKANLLDCRGLLDIRGSLVCYYSCWVTVQALLPGWHSAGWHRWALAAGGLRHVFAVANHVISGAQFSHCNILTVCVDNASNREPCLACHIQNITLPASSPRPFYILTTLRLKGV